MKTQKAKSLREFQQNVAGKFEAKADAQKAITSSQTDFVN